MNRRPVVSVLLSALFFGLSAPFSKILLQFLSPIVLAGLLYIGAFASLFLHSIVRNILGGIRGERSKPRTRAALRKKDLGWLAGAVLAGGIIGPICLMSGLARTTGFSASLLLNLEGAATALLAVLFFREQAGGKTWLALGCMTLAGIFTAWDPGRGRFSAEGPILILAAMVCWGLDNNFTRNVSDKDPVAVAGLKCLFAGTGLTALALALGGDVPFDAHAGYALLVGAGGYGLSLVLFIGALRGLGAFRTGAFFSLAPFIGGLGSLIILREKPGWPMLPAAAFMALGVFLILKEHHVHRHRHDPVTHSHAHDHGDGHHDHFHPDGGAGKPHCHEHSHEAVEHLHPHWPDTHHRHGHGSD
ncbi:MAG: DMT family transporter [Candidatus Aminicenantales bacterium]